MKLTTSILELAAMMPRTGELSPTFVRVIGLIDLALILPSLTRILPRVTVVAALCCIVLQILAANFHTFRGEFAVLPLNALLLGLVVFIFWGAGRRHPSCLATQVSRENVIGRSLLQPFQKEAVLSAWKARQSGRYLARAIAEKLGGKLGELTIGVGR